MVSLDPSGFTRTHQGNGQSSEMLPRAPSPFPPPERDQPWRDSPSHHVTDVTAGCSLRQSMHLSRTKSLSFSACWAVKAPMGLTQVQTLRPQPPPQEENGSQSYNRKECIMPPTR